jgi:nucleoside-diphosphate-sugar epimerase
LDWSRAAKELDWSPKISLEEGLQMTVDYFKKALNPTGGLPLTG